MATILKIQFLTGRYHATPWDSHPNEGVAEPFPAPWRILRSLVAVSYRIEPQPRDLLSQLVDRLAASPPSYYVPPSTEGHVRQSVPFEPKGQDLVQRRRLIDAFRCYGAPFSKEAAVYVRWGADLSGEQAALLADLCDRVPYIGRSQAWVQMSVVEEPPDWEEIAPDADEATIALMAPLSPQELRGFRQGAEALNLKKKEKALLPKTVLEALDIDYVEVQRQGWSQVPGSRFVGYHWKPERSRPISPPSPRRADRPKLARFRIDGDRNILPAATSALELTNRMHLALTKRSDGHPVFSGKKDGSPLTDGIPQHAKFLPEFDRRGRVVAVMVYARMGFDSEAVRAMSKLRKLPRGDKPAWYPSLEYCDRDWDESDRGSVWVSKTPFVLSRWPKKSEDRLEPQIRKLLEHEGILTPLEAIEVLPYQYDDRRLNHIPIYRPNQRYRKVPEWRYWLRLRFAEPVKGPIAIGWNCHYGLGQFRRSDCAEG